MSLGQQTESYKRRPPLNRNRLHKGWDSLIYKQVQNQDLDCLESKAKDPILVIIIWQFAWFIDKEIK